MNVCVYIGILHCIMMLYIMWSMFIYFEKIYDESRVENHNRITECLFVNIEFDINALGASYKFLCWD
jgi:hypothetical protein